MIIASHMNDTTIEYDQTNLKKHCGAKLEYDQLMFKSGYPWISKSRVVSLPRFTTLSE